VIDRIPSMMISKVIHRPLYFYSRLVAGDLCHFVCVRIGWLVGGMRECPFGLSSQGDGAMPRTTRRASTSRALPPIFKNRFNQVPSVTEYPLIKRIRTDTTIDLSKILPRRVAC
jgi:hypothetical protein